MFKDFMDFVVFLVVIVVKIQCLRILLILFLLLLVFVDDENLKFVSKFDILHVKTEKKLKIYPSIIIKT